MPSQRELIRAARGSDPDGLDPVLALRWAAFNETLMKLEEPQVERLLAREREKRKRLHVLLRLQGRLSKLRRARERADLTKIAR